MRSLERLGMPTAIVARHPSRARQARDLPTPTTCSKLARAERHEPHRGLARPYRQTIAIDHCMDFARQAAARPSHRLALIPCDAGSMLMDADNGGVDHLDSGIMGSGKCVYDAAPDTSPPPADEPVVASGVWAKRHR